MTDAGKNGATGDAGATQRDRDIGARDTPGEIASEALLGEHRAIRIRHGGELYTLRRTSSGKLILTK